jgi:hypothetical protein
MYVNDFLLTSNHQCWVGIKMEVSFKVIFI